MVVFPSMGNLPDKYVSSSVDQGVSSLYAREGTWNTLRAMRGSRASGTREPDAIKQARFNEYVLVHVPALKSTAARLCPQPAQAADLVQDTLERAWRRFESLEHEDRARPWLVRIMRNAWVDKLRRAHLEVPIDDMDVIAAVHDEPSRWEAVTVDDIHTAIKQLDEPFYTVAVLHDVDGLSYVEIASRLNIRNGTAASRLHRAHSRIRELLRNKLVQGKP